MSNPDLYLVRNALSRVYNKSNNTIERFQILNEVEDLVKELRQSTINNIDLFEKSTDTVTNTVTDNISEVVAKDALNRIITIVSWQSGLSTEYVSEVIKNNILLKVVYDDFGFDSLDMVETVMALEEEFEIEISDDAAESCTTIQCLIDLVTKKG